jgi:hypothetical protein
LNFVLVFYGYKFSAGYAGVSHNVHYSNYLQWKFPFETFQFALEINTGLFDENYTEKSNSILRQLIISLGMGETLRLGKARTHSVPSFYEGVRYEAENNLNFSLEAAFYFNETEALVSSINYNAIPFSYSYESYKLLESQIESFSFFSSYRYHLLKDFQMIFLQGGFGIVRMNPVVKTQPRYDYNTALQASAGLTIDFLDPIIVMPVIDYNFILNFIAFPKVMNAPRILGYNQILFNLKLGYKFF